MVTDDLESIETVYNVVKQQYELNIKSSEVLNARLSSIIGFIGVILNIELLSLVQILVQEKTPDGLILLPISCIFLVVSLGFAIKSYVGQKFHTIDAKKFYKVYKTNKTKYQIFDELSKKISDYVDKNKKITIERNRYLNYTLYSLISAIVLVVIFIIDNVLILI